MMDNASIAAGRATLELGSLAAIRIVQEAAREGVTIDDLARLAQVDPEFALKLLKLVNSPALTRGTPVRDITQAASLLGIEGLRNLALSLAVGELMPDSAEANSVFAQSLRRALAAVAVGELVKFPEPHACFTTGLLLDVGILGRVRTNLEASLDLARLPPDTRVLHERVRYGDPHPFAGSQFARLYRLPEDMALAIATHHEPIPPDAPLSRIAWLAERIAGVFETGAVEAARSQLSETAPQLGLLGPQLDAILNSLPAQIGLLGKSFGRDLGGQEEFVQLKADANGRLAETNRPYEETVLLLREVLQERDSTLKMLEELNLLLTEQAATDVLTEMPNRRALEEALERELANASRTGAPMSIVLFDVDRFKLFNDTHGHLVGDDVLRHIARVAKKCLRGSDFVGRYGGEEFCLLLPDSDVEASELAARRVRLAIERARLSSSAGSLAVTASFGVTTFEAVSPRSSTDLLREADEAMYAAKQRGRNCVVHYSQNASASKG